MGRFSPQTPGGGSSATVHIYLEDVDAGFDRAVAAGCTVVGPLANAFWGDRYGMLVDPFGHRWSMATHIRNISAEEIQRAGMAVAEEVA